MLVASLELLAGFVLLWKGGDWLVDGSDRFARSWGVPATLTGVVILGFGTSFPELATSVMALIDKRPGTSVGNVVGSNIANVGLILGVTAALAVIPINRFLLRIEIPFGIAASLLAVALTWDGVLDQLDSFILLGAFIAYMLVALATAKRREIPDAADRPAKHTARDITLAVIGLIGVLAGARLFLAGADTFATEFGLSEGVVGLTLVALATSLPELAAGLAAIRARKPDLALGNVIGSNIFNLLMVLGVAGAVQSTVFGGTLAFPDSMRQVDLPVMTGLAIMPLLLGVTMSRIPRWAGLLLVAIYGSYIAFFSGVVTF
jgi:cation:H+ antiporter